MSSDFLFPVQSYLKFLVSSKTKQGHAVHSPFVFNLIQDVFNDKGIYYAYKDIEQQRKALLKNTKQITITDFGAGSRVFSSNERSIHKIAQSSLLPVKYAQLLFRLVNRFQPDTILELGSSLGISTAYMAKARSKAQVYSMEGCPEILKIAQASASACQANNIEFIQGNFNETLPQCLSHIEKVDFAFIDGNHSYQPTVDYFNQILEKTHNDSILIFDDIYWSKDMQKAWQDIIHNQKVSVSVDIFKMGLVFFRKESSKEHFKVRF